MAIDLLGFKAGKWFAKWLLKGAKFNARTFQAIKRFGDKAYALAVLLANSLYSGTMVYDRRHGND